MSYNEEFFKSLGVEMNLDEGEDGNSSDREKAIAALKEIIVVCAAIREEAVHHKFSMEESYDFAMAYYTMFLGANLQVAMEQKREDDGKEES